MFTIQLKQQFELSDQVRSTEVLCLGGGGGVVAVVIAAEELCQDLHRC